MQSEWKRINPVAKSLAHAICQPKIVKPKKGRGAYKRKPRGAKHVEA